MSLHMQRTQTATRHGRLRPMGLGLSVLYFAVPSAVLNATVRLLVPTLDRAGLPPFLNYLISIGGPLLLLLAASLLWYRADGYPWSWQAFRDRFRLGHVSARTWWWTAGLSVIMLLGPSLLTFSADWIRSFAPPSAVVDRMFQLDRHSFMGEPTAGAYLLLLGLVCFAVVNVLGEELWWRGYVLPRQEASMGRWAWLAQGLLWTLFHSFFLWELIGLLPGALALAYVAQRCRSTWPGVVAHTLATVPGIVTLAVGVAG